MVLVVWSRFLFNTEKTLDVNWELNNICNLMCPQCVRNEIVDGKIQWKIDRLNTIDTNLMTFKVAYNNIKHPIRVIRFSGNVSEPLASKEFLEICKWIRYDTDSSVQVHTNGSIRTPEYWKKLGKLFSEAKIANFGESGSVILYKFHNLRDISLVIPSLIPDPTLTTTVLASVFAANHLAIL